MIIDWKNPINSMIGGAALGALLSSLSTVYKVIIFTYRYFFVKSYLEGIWHSYHWTYLHHVPKIVSSDIVISKGILYRYTFKLKQNTTLSYAGNGAMEGDHIVFTIKGETHNEKTICRFPDILPSSNELFGLWLSYDHDKKVAGGAILLTKTELDSETAARVLADGILHEKDAILMHVLT